jgi:carboxyl-terminal processing protease
MRDGESKPLDFTITRAKVENPTVEYQMLDNKIGYIIISEFDDVTVTRFQPLSMTLRLRV